MQAVFKGKTKITECPDCGSDEFCVITKFSGQGEYNYRFDGEPGDNTELHNGVRYKDQKTAYCSSCKIKLGMVKNVEDR